MKARISFPVVVIGPIHNGTREHAATITRVWGDPEADTVDGPVVISALMFPDGGGESQHQSSIHLFDSRALALEAGARMRCAYWAVNS